jgi:hypothetical protein
VLRFSPFCAGTHVAGIVGAKNTGKGVVGVSPNIGIYSLKILDSSGIGVLSDAMRAIKWVMTEGSAKGIKVINLSLAGHVDPGAGYYKAMVDMFCGVCKEASDAGEANVTCYLSCYMLYVELDTGLRKCLITWLSLPLQRSTITATPCVPSAAVPSRHLHHCLSPLQHSMHHQLILLQLLLLLRCLAGISIIAWFHFPATIVGTASPCVSLLLFLAGISIIAAAGNDGRNINEYIPAVCPTVITVTALDQNGRKGADWSNYADAADAAAKAHTFAGPGTAIVSTVPKSVMDSGYLELGGTSMVSAVFTSMLQLCNPCLSCQQRSVSQQGV